MKKILSVIFLFLLVTLEQTALFYLGSINQYCFNKTLLQECMDALNSDNERFVTEIEINKSPQLTWSKFTYIVENEFTYLMSPATFRISNSTISCVSETGSIESNVSDIFTLHENYRGYKMNSAYLKTNVDYTQLNDDSIIINKKYAEALGVGIGDTVSISANSSEPISLMVFDVYDRYPEANDQKFLNNLYIDDFNSPIFIPTVHYEKLVSSNRLYCVFGRTQRLLNAIYSEFEPLLLSEKNRLKMVEHCSFNKDKKVNNLSFYEHATWLEIRINNLNNRPTALVASCAILVFLSLSVSILLLVSNLVESSEWVRHHYVIVLSILITSMVLIGLLTILIGSRVFVANYLIGKYGFFVSSKIPTLLVVWGTIISLLLTSIYYIYCRFIYFSSLEISTNNSKIVKKYKLNTFTNDNDGKPLELVCEKTENPKILFLGSFNYPIKSAGGIRVLDFAKIVGKHDGDAVVSCFSTELEPFKEYSFNDNVSIIPYGKAPNSVLQKLHLFFFPTKDIKKLFSLINVEELKTIYIYSVFPVHTVKYIKKIAKENDINIIFDVVEWFYWKDATATNFFSEWSQNQLLNKKIIDSNDKVIAISSYLSTYFESKDIQTLTVPFINDTSIVTPIKNRSKDDGKIKILYFGNPSKGKDLIKPIFEAINELDEETRNKFVVVIAGSSINTLCKESKLVHSDFKNAKDNVAVLGKVDRSQIAKLCSKCDFSILVRDENKVSAKAGFPTKISESLAYGLIPITNLTSDLSKYLNRSNSVIINGHDKKAVLEGIKKAISLKKETINKMKTKSRETAVTNLDVSVFKDKLIKFFDK